MLGLFTLIYAFNFIDRQIVTVLAPFLKADLGLSDAQVGLLFGTAFALFYALFGLPLARLVDEWHRVGTLAIGLALWSAMTALSGFATSFAQLALARVGVGIGEASASPAAYSVLQDYFAKEKRATALAIYSSGIYIGAGASLMIGGGVIAAWNDAYAGGGAPLGLAGWQAAYLAVGLPGVLLAVLALLTVREPVRGAIDGRPHGGDPHPFRAMMRELAAIVPPFTLMRLRSLGAPRRLILRNALLLVACAIGATLLVIVTDAALAPSRRAIVFMAGDVAVTTNMVQWCAIAVGVYGALSWVTALKLHDPATASLTINAPSFVALAVGGGLLSFTSYGIGTFIFVYGREQLGLEATDAFTIGAIAAAGGAIGTPLGGIIADRALRRHPAGRLYVAIAAVIVSSLFVIAQYLTTSVTLFYVTNFFYVVTLTMWLGPVAASGQDHVQPQMRGTATAVMFLGINLIGLGLGPYWVGLISDVTGDLRLAILSALATIPIVIGLFLFAAKRLPAAEARAAALP